MTIKYARTHADARDWVRQELAKHNTRGEILCRIQDEQQFIDKMQALSMIDKLDMHPRLVAALKTKLQRLEDHS